MNKHEEKRKNDVKENEKTCGQHAQNLGTEAKNRLFGAGKIGGGQKWIPLYFRQWGIFYKQSKKQKLLPFLNSYYCQNCRHAGLF